MKTMPVNNQPLIWQNGAFVPHGKLDLYTSDAMADNPFNWSSTNTWSARVIVGFKRRGKKPLTLSQLVRVVREIRTEQVGDPSATFVTQRGIYKHQTPRGTIVDEPGAQVIIFNTPSMKTSPTKFLKQMEQLSEDLATELGQEEVIVELQKNGVTQRSWGMGPRR